MTSRMRAAVYSAFGGSIAVKDLPKPEAPPGGVLIEVKATGVCRSDWHGWKGHDSDIVDHGLPFVPGHELSGIVAQLGEGVSGFAVGDRVAVPFILSCGGCRECKRGRATICEDQEQPGFTRFGSFAEFVALPRADRNLAHLPAEVSFEAAAALGCRGTTAYRAVVQQVGLRATATVTFTVRLGDANPHPNPNPNPSLRARRAGWGRARASPSSAAAGSASRA